MGLGDGGSISSKSLHNLLSATKEKFDLGIDKLDFKGVAILIEVSSHTKFYRDVDPDGAFIAIVNERLLLLCHYYEGLQLVITVPEIFM